MTLQLQRGVPESRGLAARGAVEDSHPRQKEEAGQAEEAAARG